MSEHLSDDALWDIVRQPLAHETDTRLRQLTQASKAREMTDDEQAELDRRLSEYSAWVLRRSEAMLALKERGYDVIGNEPDG